MCTDDNQLRQWRRQDLEIRGQRGRDVGLLWAPFALHTSEVEGVS